MRLVIICGMPSEAAVLQAALPGVLILTGAAKDRLGDLVPPDTTHIASAGLCGGLSPRLKIADVCLAGLLVDGAGESWLTNSVWRRAILDAMRLTPGPRNGDIGDQYDMETPPRLTRAITCTWYSSGVFDQADTALQRAALLERTGALAVDDQSRSVAEFAAARGLPFTILGSVSDDASETLPLAMRGKIMNADGSANLEYFRQRIAKESISQTLEIPKIIADFNSSLATLGAAAPALLQALN